MHQWHKSLLHKVIPPLIEKWEVKLNVNINQYFLQRMKTKWGACNHQARNIRLNTELVKKPKDLLEYVIVHEMAHLIEPTHNDRFVALLNEHYQAGEKLALNSMNYHSQQKFGVNSQNYQILMTHTESDSCPSNFAAASGKIE